MQFRATARLLVRPLSVGRAERRRVLWREGPLQLRVGARVETLGPPLLERESGHATPLQCDQEANAHHE